MHYPQNFNACYIYPHCSTALKPQCPSLSDGLLNCFLLRFPIIHRKRAASISISFYYFKNSQNGALTVILQDMDKPDDRIILNEYTGLAYDWTKATPNFFKATEGHTYKMILSSSMQYSSYPNPYIAIDDISFTKQCALWSDGPIPTLETLPGGMTQTFAPDDCSTVRCKNNESQSICLTVDQMCNFVKDCADGSDEKNCGDCNFDDGTLCEWSSSSSRKHWKNQMPASVSPGNAPKVDGNQLAIGGYAAIYSPGVLRFMNTRKC